MHVCDRADTSLDFIAVYNANKDITHTISVLQRKGGEENQSEEPLAETAALEIQSTRSSMSIQGKMLLGHSHPCHLFQPVCYNCLYLNMQCCRKYVKSQKARRGTGTPVHTKHRHSAEYDEETREEVKRETRG